MQSFGVNVVVIRDNQVLLTLRSDLPVWCLPGGAIEAGESLVEAAKREALEETGVEVEITGIVGIYSRPYWQNSGNHEVVFVGRQTGGVLFPHDGEAVDISYFNLAELPETLIWWHRERIHDAVNTRGTVARIQDVRWPLEGTSYEESKRLVAEGKLPVEELTRYFCQTPSDNQSRLELSGIKHALNG
jgi:ADP-ribose pyrophosphatase YjhB (NUDIX family)